MARDRALQSSIFRTNTFIVYSVAVLALASGIIYLTQSIVPETLQIYLYICMGPILQVIIIFTMTVLFGRPLLRHSSVTGMEGNETIRAIVMRTAIGAALHLLLELFAVVLLVISKDKSGSIGDYPLLWVFFIMIPRTLHISISHRDEKPILYAIETYRGSETRQARLASSLRSYRSKTITTFEGEFSGTASLLGDSLQDDESFSLSNKMQDSTVV